MAKKPRTTPEEQEAHRVAARAYYYRNKAKHTACTEKARIKRSYGLTLEELDALKLSQDNRCALCKKQAKLVVDHCHTDGHVRGLLCHGCNTGIGQLGDSIEGLEAAIKYIRSTQPSNV